MQLPTALQELLSEQGSVGDYARSGLRELVNYCEPHLSEIASDAGAIDTAMQFGYSWRKDPFALAAKAADIIDY